MAARTFDFKSKESDTDKLAHIQFSIGVEIYPGVYEKVMYWIHKSNFEVSGLGKVIYDPARNVLKVIDAYLVKQENSYSATELDGEAVAKLMYESREVPGDLRWWWHSHVNMDVFWSGTDIQTIKELGGAGNLDHPSWFSMTVFNKKEEMLSAYVQNSPVRSIVSNLPTEVLTVVDVDKAKIWDKEYADHVTEKSYGTTHYGPSSYKGYESHWEGSWAKDRKDDKKDPNPSTSIIKPSRHTQSPSGSRYVPVTKRKYTAEENAKLLTIEKEFKDQKISEQDALNKWMEVELAAEEGSKMDLGSSQKQTDN